MTFSLDTSGIDASSDAASSANLMLLANDLQTQLAAAFAGTAHPFTKQLLTAPSGNTSIVTSNGLGTIPTPTNDIVYLAAESGTSDTLDYIGISNNRRIVLKAANGHSITLTSGVGNITTIDNNTITLTGNIAVEAWCFNSQWCIIGTAGVKNNLSATVPPVANNDASQGYDYGSMWIDTLRDRVWFNTQPNTAAGLWSRATPYGNYWRIKAAAATLASVGIAAVTIANTPAAANDANGTLVTLPTTASSGNLGGFVTATFNLVHPEHNPTLEVLIEMDATITLMRVWIGLTSADVTNTDTLTTQKFIGWRWSTVAGDAGFTPILCDGTTMHAGTAIGSVLASSLYKLKLWVDNTNSQVYFTVNDGPAQVMSTNYPAGSTEMGLTCRPITQSAAIRDIKFSYAEVGWG